MFILIPLTLVMAAQVMQRCVGPLPRVGSLGVGRIAWVVTSLLWSGVVVAATMPVLTSDDDLESLDVPLLHVLFPLFL